MNKVEDLLAVCQVHKTIIIPADRFGQVLLFRPVTDWRMSRLWRSQYRKHEVADAAFRRSLDSLSLLKLRDDTYELDHKIFSAASYLNQASMDLAASTALLFTTRHKPERNLLLRVICVNLFEAAKDLQALLGGDFYRFLKERGDDRLRARASARKKPLDVFFNQHGRYLKEIRDNCIAHRDGHYLRFLLAKQRVGHTRVLSLVTEFVEISSPLYAIFEECGGLIVRRAVAREGTRAQTDSRLDA